MKRYLYTSLICGFCIIVSIASFPNHVFADNPASQEEELFFIAQKAFDDGFYDVAIRYIEQFLQKFPATEYYAKARLLYGQCHFFKNQYLTALEIFQSLYDEKLLPDATLYWLGETYFKGSDYRKAQSFYKKVVEQYPDSEYVPQAYYSLGWTFFEQGEYQTSQEYFNDMIRLFPDNALKEDALFKLGEAQLNLSDYTLAAKSFEDYVKLYPKSERTVDAMFYLAESYYYSNDFLKANTFYARTAELSDNPKMTFMSKIGMGWIYLKLKKYNLAEQHFQSARELSEKHNLSDEELLLGEGALYTEIERYEQARSAYQAFIKKFPNNLHLPEALIGKAHALYLMQNYADAIKAYNDILQYSENHVIGTEIIERAHYGIAWAYLKQGDVPNAVETFETIIAQADNDTVKASALSQIGDAYQETDQLANALNVYDRILNEFPETLYTDYAQFQQGITLLKMGEIEAANASFQSLKVNFPDSEYKVDADYYLGFVHFQKQEWSDAILYINNFIDHSDNKDFFMEQAEYILALSYFQTRQYAEAIKLFRAIVAELTSQPSIKQTAEIFIGKCLYELGKPNQAIQHFKNVIQNYPLTGAHQDALLWLGSYYFEKQEFSTALTFYKKFIETFPGSEKTALAYYELGQTHLGLNQLDAALTAFKKVPDDADSEILAKAKLAIAEIFSTEMGPQVALEKYQQIAEKVPSYQRDALVKIAKIYEDSDAPQKAIEVYQDALNTPPASSLISNAQLHFEIADKYEILNKRDKAVEEYLKIPYLAKHEKDWIIKAYLRVARIFEDTEQWDQAKLTYSKILDLNISESKYAKERLNWINENLQKH